MTPVSPPPTQRHVRTPGRAVEEIVDLTAGAVTVFLPFVIPAVPAIALVVVPVVAAGAVVALAGALLALPLMPPYLLLRAVRGRRDALSPRRTRM